jgi:Rieske 2Fe-2S family protein
VSVRTDLRSASLPDALLPRDAISAVLAPEFSQARTLPRRAYLSDDVLVWERRHIFGSGWICIGRSDLVADPGSQRALSVGGNGVLLVRDTAGRLRAFHNTCRHRGHELLAEGECQTRRTIACPYHSWVYNLDGSLRQAARFTDLASFDAEEFPLLPVAVEEWHGWIFVNAEGAAEPLSSWLGNLGDYLADWEPDRLAPGTRHEYVVAANWKVILENFVECYHCPSIHPELCRVSDPESGSEMFPQKGMWLGGPMELRGHASTQSLSGEGSGFSFRGLSAEKLREIRYFVIFPNLLISPHPDYVMTHRLIPLSPTETFVECAWLFPPEAVASPSFDPSFASDFWDRTNAQDFAACESVMRGMHSPGYRPGLFDHREVIVHTVQTMIARAYLEGRMPAPTFAHLPAVA